MNNSSNSYLSNAAFPTSSHNNNKSFAYLLKVVSQIHFLSHRQGALRYKTYTPIPKDSSFPRTEEFPGTQEFQG